MELTLHEISGASSGKLFYGAPLRKIKGVSIDSRTIRPRELFVPLKGEHSNGHNFLREAKKGGAVAALVRRNFPSSNIPGGLPYIRVRNPFRALGILAGYYRLKFNIPVIAITGSCGKTTVKDMLAGILLDKPAHRYSSGVGKFRGIRAEGNYNNLIGLPLTLFRLRDKDEIAILEMGTNSPGEISSLARISRPSVGVITNINPVHIEGLGSLEGIRREKESLLLNLPDGSKAVLNYDDRLLRKMGERFRGEVITFGLGKKADFRADEVRIGERSISFRLNGGERFFLPLPGRANLYNALAAIAAASLFDVPVKEMRNALKSMKSLPHRLNISKAGRVTLIDDTYNANPASFRLAIDVLTSIGGRGRYIVAAGDMLELGNISPKEHFNLGYYIGKKGVDFLVAFGSWRKEIMAGARRGGLKKDKIFSADSPQAAAQIILNMVKPCDKILCKASRKTGLERAVNVLSSSLSSL